MKFPPLAIGIVTGLFLAVPLAHAGEVPFWDITSGEHFEAIYWMKEWGVFEGYSGGKFDPVKEINRAELSKVLVLGSGVAESDVATCADGTSHDFSDVVAGEWYEDYVYCAKAKGWVKGDDGATTFRPGDPVLLPEAFKMIVESQYGYPGANYAGAEWYDVYLNVLLDHNFIYESEYGYFYYTFIIDSLGFDAVITSKATRDDIAELIYRLRVVLAETDGTLADYNPLMTLDEYESVYGATVSMEEDGTLRIEDPHHGFQIENVYLGQVEMDDLLVWIDTPSGFENGWKTEFNLMYPTLSSEYDDEGLEHSDFFDIHIYDLDYSTDEPLTAGCESSYGSGFDLWDVYDTMCGVDGAASDELEALLRLSAYGETYSGDEPTLQPITDEPVSTLYYSDLFLRVANAVAWYEDGSGDRTAYLNRLYEVESVNVEQQAAFTTWLETFQALMGEFVENFYDSSYDSSLDYEILYHIDDLEAIIAAYELEIIESFGETLVVEVELSEVKGHNREGWAMYNVDWESIEVIEGNINDYFWDDFSIIIAEENDPWDGAYFGSDTSITEYVRLTIDNDPQDYGSTELDYESAFHIFQYAKGFYQDAYYYPILEIEVL